MSVLLFVLFGFIVGLLARAIMPGEQKLGMFGTTLLGIAGSFLGGYVGHIISSEARYGSSFFELRSSGIIGSILGALGILALLGWFGRRSARFV
jgi:uncharacterized membrane protein YeaQ/YmgE (transglycosylase-associated protein family)